MRRYTFMAQDGWPVTVTAPNICKARTLLGRMGWATDSCFLKSEPIR